MVIKKKKPELLITHLYLVHIYEIFECWLKSLAHYDLYFFIVFLKPCVDLAGKTYQTLSKSSALGLPASHAQKSKGEEKEIEKVESWLKCVLPLFVNNFSSIIPVVKSHILFIA